jgi:hypothetical protein
VNRAELIGINNKDDHTFENSMFSVALEAIKIDHKSYHDLAQFITDLLLKKYFKLYGKRYMTVVGLINNFDLFYTRGTKEQRKFIKFSIRSIIFSIYQI